MSSHHTSYVWPTSPDPSEIGVDPNFVIYGARFPGGVKSGDVGALFAYLITQLHERVEKMMINLDGSFGYGCTGYSYRAGFHDPSQVTTHGSGTAIDYNAPKHTGSTHNGGWSPAAEREIRDILEECSGAILWDVKNNPSHFEINGTPAQVTQAVNNLVTPLPGPNPEPPNPTPTPTPGLTITQSMTGAY